MGLVDLSDEMVAEYDREWQEDLHRDEIGCVCRECFDVAECVDR